MDPIAADGDLDGDEALTSARNPRLQRWWFLYPVLILTSLGLWMLLRPKPADRPPEREAAEEAVQVSGAAAGPPAVPVAPAPRSGVAAVVAAGVAGMTAIAATEGPDPATVHDDGGVDALVPSHPITAERVRIHRENNLVGALNGAMDVSDGAGLRKLLDQYREEFPDDPNQLQEGYRIIADCLQRPGPAAKATAQRYYDQERGSILRRFVSRHCLEP